MIRAKGKIPALKARGIRVKMIKVKVKEKSN